MWFKTKLNKDTGKREPEKFPKHFLADTEEEALKLLKDFDYTINLLAYKYSVLTNLSEDDLKQEALIGLSRASREFNVDRSEQFKIYAIYKIKDALRDFSTDQSIDISIPEYLVDTVRFISKIYKYLLLLSVDTDGTYFGIWNSAIEFISKENIVEDDNINVEDTDIALHNTKRELKATVKSLEGLATRSKTTALELINRAELLPINKSVDEDGNAMYDAYSDLTDNQEDTMLDSIVTSTLIKRVKDVLSEDEYNLLVAHYIEGKTLRELETILHIKAPSIIVRIQKVIEKVRKRTIQDECAEYFKDIG